MARKRRAFAIGPFDLCVQLFPCRATPINRRYPRGRREGNNVKYPHRPEAPQRSPASPVSHERPSRRLHPGGASLVDVLELVLDKGLVVAGDIKVSLADIELLTLRIRLIVCSIDKACLLYTSPSPRD